MNPAPIFSDDAEASVLGGVFLRPDILPSLSLTVDDFFSPRHQAVYQAMRNLEAQARPIDPMTVVAELERVGRAEVVGGLGFVSELALRVPTAENARHYAETVVRYAQRRLTLRALSDALHRIKHVADEDADDVLLETVGELQRIESRKPDPTVPLGDSMRRELRQAGDDWAAREAGQHVGGMPTGIDMLDGLTGGLPPGKLTIVLGETGHGKTTLAMTFLRAAIDIADDEPILFSYEDDHASFAQRGLAQESGVPTQNIARRMFFGDDIRKLSTLNAETFRRRRERVAMCHGMPVDELCRTVRRLRARGPQRGGKTCGRLVVVDYLQRIPRDRRLQQPEAIGLNAYALEALAAQEGISVVVMSQVNDEVEKREKDHRPRYRDCAGSRDPVKAAKLVLGIYRPEVYDENADPREGQIGVLKNNQGKSPGWKRHVAVRLDLETHTIRDASDDLGRRRMEAV